MRISVDMRLLSMENGLDKAHRRIIKGSIDNQLEIKTKPASKYSSFADYMYHNFSSAIFVFRVYSDIMNYPEEISASFTREFVFTMYVDVPGTNVKEELIESAYLRIKKSIDSIDNAVMVTDSEIHEAKDKIVNFVKVYAELLTEVIYAEKHAKVIKEGNE